MQEIDFKCWDQFLEHANGLIEEAEAAGSVSAWNEPLFRGQADSSWGLSTTVERHNPHEIISCAKYHNDMRTAAAAIKTVANVSLDFDEWAEPEHSMSPTKDASAMVWLRQNGFPSPLLDWSQSPFVASFFAYHAVDPKNTPKVSIYTFIESRTGSRSGSRPADSPQIISLGQWIPTDKKHFLQQSRYTVSRGKENGRYLYASHEEAMKWEEEADTDQMDLVKCNMPAGESDLVMRRLRKMNVTRFSLFETTDALLKTIADDLFTGRVF